MRSDRLRWGLLLVVVTALASSARADTAALPLPLTLTTQEYCHRLPNGSGTIACTSSANGSSVQHVFSGFENQMSFTGQFQASLDDGRLVFTMSGQISNMKPQPDGWEVLGTSELAFAVPQVDSAQATTLISANLTKNFSTLASFFQRTLTTQPLGGFVTSTVLGPNLRLPGLTTSISQFAASAPPDSDQVIAVLPASDQVTTTLSTYYAVTIPANSTANFAEQFTYELRYVPEPGSPLMLSSGAGFLALLAGTRLAR